VVIFTPRERAAVPNETGCVPESVQIAFVLPTVLWGSETLLLSLKAQYVYTVSVSEQAADVNVWTGGGGGEVAGMQRFLHTQRLRNVLISSNIMMINSMRARWADNVPQAGERRTAQKVEGKRPLDVHK
jgi:hypothetical protein